MKKTIILLFILSACGGSNKNKPSEPVIQPLPVINFSSSTTNIEANLEFFLSWSSINASACSASGDWNNTIGISGTQSIIENTPGSKTYTITCSGNGGESSSSLNVEITEQILIPTASISSSKASVVINEEFTLNWESTDATNCIASGSWDQSISTSGSKKLSEQEPGNKTYSINCSGAGGSASSSVDVSVNDEQSETAFYGSVIDGYISGAEVFIDQNFNFERDDGEYGTTSISDGTFSIETSDANIYDCLKNRPVVANVPVGAFDSTLGGVTEEYQMVLPSINDSGTNTIVVSPFTSLFSEAILFAKNGIVEDLSLSEGCSAKGDEIASLITQRIDELKNSLQTNFNITYSDLIGDFIQSSGDIINEETAQNIAKIFPHIQQIDSQISTELSTKFNKEINANVSLSDTALDIIFGENAYEKLPLDFRSSYRTEENTAGWYQDETIEASGAYISKDGILSREDCSEIDTQLCNISSLSLKNIANASTSFVQASTFLKQNIDFDEIGITNGSLAVQASDRRSWRNNSANWQEKNNRDRECQLDNQIQFQNTVIAGTQSNFHYSSYSQGYEKAECENVRHYYFPILRVSTIVDQSINDNSLGLSYYIPDITRSGISSNLPYDFISNRVDIDPLLVVSDIASLPRTLKEIQIIRGMFNGEDYVLYEYNKDSQLNSYFEIGTNPRNDMFWDYISGNDDRLYGQEARTAFFNRISEEQTFNSDILGSSAPINSSVLGRIANSYIEVIDYNEQGEIIIPVYPSYLPETKTLDFSLIGASLNLKNVQDFIANGVDGNPVSANIWFNPDDSITGVVPVRLYLFKGTEANLDSNEGYFSIEFNLNVSSFEGPEANAFGRSATQEWEVPDGEEIKVKYIESNIEISKTITNEKKDKITLRDGTDISDLSESIIKKPSSLDSKILALINSVSENIDGIQSFFVDDGEYTLMMDIGSGGHTVLDFYRNTVNFITATFVTSNSQFYPISVSDMRIDEGSSKDLCFFRPSAGDLSETSIDLSFTQRERPGQGGLDDDFSLSSNSVDFANGQTESCITFTASEDNHFDWVHYIYLDLSQPTNGQALSRTQVKISILDSYGYQNRISWKAR